MKIYKLLFVLTALLLMTSCHDDFGSEQQDTRSAIEFGLVEESENTRGTATDETLLQTKGYILWAAKNSDTSFDPATDKVDFLFQEPVSYSGGAWQYENRKFWPESGALSFFAVGPADQFGGNLNTEHKDTDAGAPILTYEVPVTLEDQADIVIAQVPNRSNDGTTVDFDFEHMLSRIDFKVVRPNQPDTKIYLRKFEIYYKNNTISRKCDINLNDKTIAIAADDAPFTSGSSDDVLAGTVYNDAEKALDLTAISLDDNLDKSLFVVPQDYTEGDLYVKLSYTAKTDDGTIKETEDDKIVNLPLGTATLEKGKNYTYTLSIGSVVATGITYDAATDTYHVTSAEGLDVLNQILRSVNASKVSGCGGVPNGTSTYPVSTISIDNDIDMADLGDTYNWTLMPIDANLEGNNHTIYNLKCIGESGVDVGFITSRLYYNTTYREIKDLEIRNPVIRAISADAAGFAVRPASGWMFINCRVIDDNYTDPTHFAIQSEGKSAAGFYSRHYSSSSSIFGYFINCIVQANINGDTAFGFGQNIRVSNEGYYRDRVIGCYVKMNKIIPYDEDNIFTKERTNLMSSYDDLSCAVGCGLIYGDVSAGYEQLDGFPVYDRYTRASFGTSDYTSLKGEKIAMMNIAVLDWCADNGVAAPDKLYSLDADDFTFVENTAALRAQLDTYRVPANGITYDSSTNTYHITTAEGLSVLNNIVHNTNTLMMVPGKETIPVSTDYYFDSNISIDNDIDMAELGDEYNWNPLKIQSNVYGNNFKISNLKCETTVTYKDAAFISHAKANNSEDTRVIKDITLYNPSIKTTSGRSCGFCAYGVYYTIEGCKLIQSNFDEEPTSYAVESSLRRASGIAGTASSCKLINCVVEANLKGSNSYGAFNFISESIHSTLIGCYTKSRSLSPFDDDEPLVKCAIVNYAHLVGSGMLYTDMSVTFDKLNGFEGKAVSHASYGTQDYSLLKPVKIAQMNNAIVVYYKNNSLGTPNKLFSLTSDDFELVDYTTALADESMTYATTANGITYNSITHTYHVSTAEGLNAMTRISNQVNDQMIAGCSFIPNGKSVDGTTNDNISIDADIDMADLGVDYNWMPLKLYGNFDGNGYSISNLRCQFYNDYKVPSFIDEALGTESLRIRVKDIKILNPYIYSSGSAAGFAQTAGYTDFERCYIIDEHYTDVNHSTIHSKYRISAFLRYHSKTNTFLFCGVQASLHSSGSTYDLFSASSGSVVSYDFVGCYAKIMGDAIKGYTAHNSFAGPGKKYTSVFGCVAIVPNVDFTLPADHLYGGSYTDDYQSIVNSYLVADYATLKSNNYIQNMNTAIEQYYTDKGLGTPPYLYSVQSDDFKLVPYGSSELVPLPAITYDAATHTYHITEAEGLDILNKIFRGVNTEAVSGCATVPNGNKFNGTDYDNISIDADLDMADMGDTYQWTPMDLPACELKGNNFEIANLKCVVDGVGEVASFIDNASGTTIRDLTIRNPLFESSGTSSRAAGFANVVLGTLVERCRVIQDDYTTSSSYAIKNTNGDGAAGFVCRAHTQSMIINCVTNVNVNFANTLGKRTTGFGPYIINTGDEATIVASYCKSASINTTAESHGLFANGATSNTNSIKVVGCLMYYPDVVSEKFSSGLKVEFVNSGTLMNFSHVPMFFGSYADINTSIQQWHAAEGLSTPPYIYDSTVTDDFVLIPNP